MVDSVRDVTRRVTRRHRLQCVGVVPDIRDVQRRRDTDAETPDSTAEEILEEARPTASPVASLCVAFRGELPLADPVPVTLHTATPLGIRRAHAPSAAALADAPAPSSLDLHDRFVSTPHAVVRWSEGSWVLEDCDSRNGTRVDGAQVTRCALRDGAVIEAGHTFMVFRSSQPSTLPLAVAADLDTRHPGLASQLRTLIRVAPGTVPVMVRGATGTGKELVARAVHARSGRSGAFQAVNCAAIAQTIAEAELFGYRKGAFSGAAEDHRGLIRAADRGTLFLDEIGDLSLPLQAALLRVLQESEVLPVGAVSPVHVDFRLVVATHRDLESMCSEGKFRADLFGRINGVTISLPPLCERKEDLGLLIAKLLRRHAGDEASLWRFTLQSARALFAHAWPLNVRELEKTLVAGMALAREHCLELEHLPEALRTASAPPARGAPIRPLSTPDEERRRELVDLLQRHRGNVTAVAQSLGKARMQIHRWIRRFGIDLRAYRP
jgi:transcriptional regulator of acetoin/glycerol metabolism